MKRRSRVRGMQIPPIGSMKKPRSRRRRWTTRKMRRVLRRFSRWKWPTTQIKATTRGSMSRLNKSKSKRITLKVEIEKWMLRNQWLKKTLHYLRQKSKTMN